VAPAPAKSVVIIDDDLGFVFWLGGLLGKAGYPAWPARSVADAAELLEELHTGLDLLIINPRVDGAAEFLAAQKRKHGIKTVAIREEEGEPLPPTDGVIERPRQFDDMSALECLGALEAILVAWQH
jgi:hypothetical protein